MRGVAALVVLLVALAMPLMGAIPIRLGLAGDDDGVRSAAAAAFRDRVEASAGGHVRVTVAGPALWGHPNASELELVRAVGVGDPPLALVSSAALTNFSSLLDVLDAPCLFRDRAQVYGFLYGPAGRGMLDALRSRGLVGMGFIAPGFRVLLTRNGLGGDLDLAGARMGTPQSLSAEAFVEAMGGEAVPAPLDRLAGMARDGFIDGADLDPCSAAASGLLGGKRGSRPGTPASAPGVSLKVTDTRHAVSTSVLIANARFLDALSPADRLALWEATLAAERAAQATHATLQAQVLATADGLTPQERAGLRARTADARRAVLQHVDAAFVPSEP